VTIVIAGERSGVGKTTLTLAILATLKQRRLGIQSFKVGPDYIDPMFHTQLTGRYCRNLDPILTSDAYVQDCFLRHSQGASYSLIEGVMGLFDGAGGTQKGSTAAIARLLDIPVVLVIDCGRLSGSVAAIAQGYRSFDPNLKFAGVILNRVGSERHRYFLTEALRPLGIPILGVLPRQAEITIPDRHLGLVPAQELPHLEQVFDRLAHLGSECLDWSQLLPLLATPAPLGTVVTPPLEPHSPIRLALARDPAFNFYYPDNLDSLQDWGAQLCEWSPLADPHLPAGVQGLYLGGGFPEVFAEGLAQNHRARTAVRQAIAAGMPVYAECGGLMYLGSTLIDFAGTPWPMAGALPFTTEMSPTLTLGYRQAKVLAASPFLTPDTVVWGQEFHRSRLVGANPAPLFQFQTSEAVLATATPTANLFEGWQRPNLHASYLHLHWGGVPDLPQRFLAQCRHWQPGPTLS
jgi:cobyrinic acid a,c-diamide synthase